MKLSSLIGHAAEVLGLIRTDTRPADVLINSFFRQRKYLGSKDRAYIAETVYHVLRHYRRLEWLRERFLESCERDALPPPFAGDAALQPHIEIILFSLLEGADRQQTEAVVTAASERTEFGRAAQFMQAARYFLGRQGLLPWPKNETARLGIEYSLPDWIMARFIAMLGAEEAEQLAGAMNQPAPITLRVNPMKAPRDAVQTALAGEGFPSDLTAYSPLGLTLRERANVLTTETFKRGWFEIQDEASQIVAYCLDPRPGTRVLDACAGGGGKALHCSALMKGRGEIIALDIVKRRLDSLRDRARRCDCQNIRIRLIKPEGPAPEDLIGRMQSVLIDAPCTGLGVLRRNPDARWKVTPESVAELAVKQRAILERFAPCVGQGGRLVYATCSVMREENEDIIAAFLVAHPEFQPGDLREILAHNGLERLITPTGDSTGNARACLCLWPHRHGADGFFIAALERSLANAHAGRIDSCG
ncbi:MAG: RsmB/NOP family class I SAM-dependent RNA methyltransferase [Candidatus Sumerlaeota bacterium]|nr:RsmB/NOP family class I SAM-dependent RNA methyltransferase [Candidatus Sumerlaeota bacterium]